MAVVVVWSSAGPACSLVVLLFPSTVDAGFLLPVLQLFFPPFILYKKQFLSQFYLGKSLWVKAALQTADPCMGRFQKEVLLQRYSRKTYFPENIICSSSLRVNLSTQGYSLEVVHSVSVHNYEVTEGSGNNQQLLKGFRPHYCLSLVCWVLK